VSTRLKGLLLLVGILTTILLGQFSSKTGTDKLSNGDQIGYLFVVLGYGFLALRGIIWMFLLRIMDLSKAYPLQSLSYVLILLLSYFVFNEEVGFQQVIGCGFIMSGALIIYSD
jgi:drug/metabolite transporter (DMT)-like permease